MIDVIDARELDTRCVPLIQAVRSRGVVPQADIDALMPAEHASVDAWLALYAQLRVWVAMPDRRVDDHDSADAAVSRALRDVPVSLPDVGEGLAVYPKSFATLLQLHVLSLQLDRLTGRLAQLTIDGTTLEQLDSVVDVATATAYVQQLIAWTWCTPGAGLPFDPTDPQPTVPEHIVALTPTELLAIAQAASSFLEALHALQVLVDPLPPRDGGRRPSWSALFEALSAEAHADPRELAVTYSLGKVLAMTRLAADRLRPAESAA